MTSDARPRPWVPLALALALLGLGIGQGLAIVTAGRSGPPVLLRLALEEGNRFRYRIDLAMEGRVSAGMVEEPLELETSSLADWQVAEVDRQGVATVEVRTRVDSASANGRPLPPGAVGGEETATMRVARDGRILEATSGLASQTGAPAPVPGVTQFLPTFPPNAVTPGDRWDTAYTQRFLEEGPGVRIVTESEFERYEDIEGVETALIRSVVSVPLDVTVPFEELQEAGGGGTVDPALAGASMRFDGAARMVGRSWFDPSRGTQLRSEVEGEIELRLGLRDLPPDQSPPPITSTNMDFDLRLSVKLLQGPS